MGPLGPDCATMMPLRGRPAERRRSGLRRIAAKRVGRCDRPTPCARDELTTRSRARTPLARRGPIRFGGASPFSWDLDLMPYFPSA